MTETTLTLWSSTSLSPDGEDWSYDDYVRAGRELASRSSWLYGDLACGIEKKYGEGTLQRYADDIDINLTTLQEYRRVARAFPENTRRRALSFGVHRELAAQSDCQELVANHDNWTVSKARQYIRDRAAFASWSQEERDLLQLLRAGETVVINIRAGGHSNLHQWAEDAGLYIRVDRRTDWGNPFETPADGDRDTVIKNFTDHYLPYKLSLQAKIQTLKGRALGCWCAPQPCHADVLKAAADAS